VLDQSYALVSTRIDDGYGHDWIRAYYVAMGLMVLLVWPVAVAVGVLAGPMIPGEWHLSLGLLPEAFRRDASALGHRGELRPHDLFVAHAGADPAVRAGLHVLAADDGRRSG
jgi:hypothetical protein